MYKANKVSSHDFNANPERQGEKKRNVRTNTHVGIW